MVSRWSIAALCCAAPLLAVAQAAPAAGSADARAEPAVQRSVIEDDNARIEELRVRGAVKSVTVRPKGPITAEYEVLTPDAGRDISDGPNSSKGAAGKRVWRVLTF